MFTSIALLAKTSNIIYDNAVPPRRVDAIDILQPEEEFSLAVLSGLDGNDDQARRHIERRTVHGRLVLYRDMFAPAPLGAVGWELLDARRR